VTDQAEGGARPELSISELAAATGRDRRTVDRWIKSGRFVGAHMVDTPTGQAWRVPVAEVVAAGLTLHAPSGPDEPAPKPAALDALAQLVAERDDWKARALVAEAVAEERGAALADLRRLVAPITAAPIGTGEPHDRTTAGPIPEPPAGAGDRRARWWRR
jgi:hypothetical protein